MTFMMFWPYTIQYVVLTSSNPDFGQSTNYILGTHYTSIYFRLWSFHTIFKQITFITQLPLTQPHRYNITFKILIIFIMWSLNDLFLLVQASIDVNREDNEVEMNKFDSKLDKQSSKLDKLMSLVKNMMHQNKNSSAHNMGSPKAQGSDMYFLVPDHFIPFTSSDQYPNPIKWYHIVISDNVEEYVLSDINKSPSETNPSVSYPSIFWNPT